MSTATITKAQAVEREFLSARANSNFSAFADLGRRYLKHNPGGAIFVNTALLEQAIAENDIASRKGKWTPAASLDDSPDHISISPRYDPDLLRTHVQSLEAVLSRGTQEQQEQAAFILARGAIRTTAPDTHQRVAHYLQNIQLPPTRVPTGYNLALAISGMVVKALVSEEAGDISGAIATYDAAIDLVLASPGSGNNSPELANWTEHAVYRGAFLKLRSGDHRAAIRTFRTLHKLSQNWGPNFRITRRISAYSQHAKALVALYVASDNNTSSDEFSPASLAVELAQVHVYWEEVLFDFTPFPKANEVNWRVPDLIERIVEERRMVGSGNDADKRSLVETIYRASQRTFQSPRIIRLLFLAQIDAGLYNEADVTLQTYWQAVQVNGKVASTELNEDNNDNGQAVLLTLEQRIRRDVESELEIAHVLVSGSRLYGHQLKNKSVDAQLFAERALDFLHKVPQTSDEAKVLQCDANKCKAAALALQVSEVHDPERRPELYAKAIAALEEASQIQPDDFEAHYLLALQLAEMREIARAIQSVKLSLSLNATHIPSWHLLTLLVSSQKDYARALEICAVGLKESEWDLPQTDLFTASHVDGDDYLSLRITQVQLLDQVHGPEAALEPQEALFALYTKVFATDPSSLGEGLYESQLIGQQQSRRRRQDTVDGSEFGTGTVGPGTLNRQRTSGSMLSIRSRRSSDAGPQSNGGMPTPSLFAIEASRPNYASSVSSIGSNGSKNRRSSLLLASSNNNNNGSYNTNGTINGNSGTMTSLLPTVTQRPTVKTQLRSRRANLVLSSLWLLSAATFRRLGRMEDSLKALEEAERVYPANPDLWYQLSLFHTVVAQKSSSPSSSSDTASMMALQKATALSSYHPQSLTRIGRTYYEAGSLEMAESTLEATTRSQGWNDAEAWYWLGKVYEDSGRLQRSRECLWYALELEGSRPIRAFGEAVPWFLD
ncbi:hypothetical protein BG004_006924 [Podila humilis]|nr:hypothetical protein BG004_006924 [Podila humilis]